MSTSASSPAPRLAIGAAAAAPLAYALGAVSLAVEAVVHVQQFAELFSDVRWIGPLFLANAIAIVVVMAGLAQPRTRRPAAWAGVTISALALGSLVISYGNGLFGWHEGGFRAAVAIAMAAEVAAIVLLTAALAVDGAARETAA